MKKLIPIEDDPSYAIDPTSNALVNRDLDMLAEYRARRTNFKMLKECKEEINTLKRELDKIKSHLNIK